MDEHDEPPVEDEAADETFVRPVDRFRRTAAGSVVAAGLLGLRDVMEGRPEREEVSIVNEAPTRPVGALDVVLDPEHPERAIAIVRRPAPDAAPVVGKDPRDPKSVDPASVDDDGGVTPPP